MSPFRNCNLALPLKLGRGLDHSRTAADHSNVGLAALTAPPIIYGDESYVESDQCAGLLTLRQCVHDLSNSARLAYISVSRMNGKVSQVLSLAQGSCCDNADSSKRC